MFISFEGPDGSGKTTQIRLLVDRLRQSGIVVLQTREPGGTALGEQIRTLVLDQGQAAVSPLAEMLLIAAARAQHVAEVLRPNLNQPGVVVISDRFLDSSLAYQGHALGIGWERVQAVNEVATEGLWPDLTILMMLSPAEAFDRSMRSGQPADRIESRGLDYYQLVCGGYALLANRFPGRVQTIDATQSVQVIHDRICQLVFSHLDQLKGV